MGSLRDEGRFLSPRASESRLIVLNRRINTAFQQRPGDLSWLHLPMLTMRRFGILFVKWISSIQGEILDAALIRVAKSNGATRLQMVSYRINIASATALIHRIKRTTFFADGRHENEFYDIPHGEWIELMAGKMDSSPLMALQELDKMRTRVDLDSYFSVLGSLIKDGQHGVEEGEDVEPRVFEHLQPIRSDLLALPKSDGLLQPADIAVEDETTKVDIKGCIACYDDFTTVIGPNEGEIGPPFRLMCGC